MRMVGGKWSRVNISQTCVLFITLLRCLMEGGLGKEVSCVFIIWVVIALGQRHQFGFVLFPEFGLGRGMMFNPAEIFYFHSEKNSHDIHTLRFNDHSARVTWSKLSFQADVLPTFLSWL